MQHFDWQHRVGDFNPRPQNQSEILAGVRCSTGHRSKSSYCVTPYQNLKYLQVEAISLRSRDTPQSLTTANYLWSSKQTIPW